MERKQEKTEWTPRSPEELQVGKFVDVLSDSGFKAVFGDEANKEILRLMLNEILPDGVRIKSMDFSTAEIPGLTVENKSIRIDLRCRGEDGTEFIIEMQRYEQENFFKRCVAYSSRIYDSNLRRLSREEKARINNRRLIEDMEYDLKPVYFVALMAVDFPHENPEQWEDRFISEYTFREKLTSEVVCESISLIFVELKRFRKSLEECRGGKEEWLYALRNAGGMSRTPDSISQKGVRQFYEACELSGFSIEKRHKFETNRMVELDYYSIINTARKRGKAEGFEAGLEEGLEKGLKKGKAEGFEAGLEKGLEKGLKKGKAEGFEEGLEEGQAKMQTMLAKHIKAMKAKGMSVADIADITGLQADEIEKML